MISYWICYSRAYFNPFLCTYVWFLCFLVVSHIIEQMCFQCFLSIRHWLKLSWLSISRLANHPNMAAFFCAVQKPQDSCEVVVGRNDFCGWKSERVKESLPPSPNNIITLKRHLKMIFLWLQYIQYMFFGDVARGTWRKNCVNLFKK